MRLANEAQTFTGGLHPESEAAKDLASRGNRTDLLRCTTLRAKPMDLAAGVEEGASPQARTESGTKTFGVRTATAMATLGTIVLSSKHQ